MLVNYTNEIFVSTIPNVEALNPEQMLFKKKDYAKTTELKPW